MKKHHNRIKIQDLIQIKINQIKGLANVMQYIRENTPVPATTGNVITRYNPTELLTLSYQQHLASLECW